MEEARTLVRYFIRINNQGWRDVSLDDFCHYERLAGFRSTGDWRPATAGFSSSLGGMEISGKILLESQDTVDR